MVDTIISLIFTYNIIEVLTILILGYLYSEKLFRRIDKIEEKFDRKFDSMQQQFIDQQKMFYQLSKDVHDEIKEYKKSKSGE